MPYDDRIVDQFLRVRARISDLKEIGEYRRALEECQKFLSQHRDLPEELHRVLEWERGVLSRVIDPNYSPPPHSRTEDQAALWVLSKEALRQGRIDEALAKAWHYMQYLSVGMYDLQWTLSEVAEIALSAGYEDLAKAAAHLYVAHLRFMEAAAENPLTPLIPLTTGEQWEPPPVPVRAMMFAPPVEVALRFIYEEDDPDWRTILELALEVGERLYEGVTELAPSLRGAPLSAYTLRMLAALVQHYQKFGKQEALQSLLQKYPEAQRFLQEGEE